jgi:SAM-dependent methyltransferase
MGLLQMPNGLPNKIPKMEPTESAVGEQTSLPSDPLAIRRRFASHLSGEGIEIGPGHVPFPVPPTLFVRYLDRWEPTKLTALFPELGEQPGFSKPDVIADLDMDRLTSFPDASLDFVIASHVLEHLANPLAMLVDIHRVLRPGALLVVLIPDRHKTFDRDRAPTSLSHLIDEYRRDVREVDDAHIMDFLIGARVQLDGHRGPDEFAPDYLNFHRQRSVHVHVWDVEEFGGALDYGAEELGLRWNVIDTMPPGAVGTYGDEFGWVLAKVEDDLGPTGRFRRFRRAALGR